MRNEADTGFHVKNGSVEQSTSNPCESTGYIPCCPAGGIDDREADVGGGGDTAPVKQEIYRGAICEIGWTMVEQG